MPLILWIQNWNTVYESNLDEGCVINLNVLGRNAFYENNYVKREGEKTQIIDPILPKK